MARPIAQGIDYFPLDVGFLRDIKVRKIIRACGISATPILIDLLSTIFRDEGYYMRWGEDEPFLIADEVGVSEGVVIETVKKAVQVDFFNANMFETYGILTSCGIQKRFFKAVERRKEICYDARFLLISVNDYKNLVNVCNNSINVYVNEQSKVKKSKVKKSKKKESIEKENNNALANASTLIVDFLNMNAGTAYKPSTAKTKALINARMNEGFTIDDFKTVITKKCSEWLNSDMEKYLRPETLFGTKFEGYLNQSVCKTAKQGKQEAIDVVNNLLQKYGGGNVAEESIGQEDDGDDYSTIDVTASVQY